MIGAQLVHAAWDRLWITGECRFFFVHQWLMQRGLHECECFAASYPLHDRGSDDMIRSAGELRKRELSFVFPRLAR